MQRKLWITAAAVGFIGVLGSYLYNFSGITHAFSFGGNPALAGAHAAKPNGVPTCLFACSDHDADNASPASTTRPLLMPPPADSTPLSQPVAVRDTDPCLSTAPRHVEVCTAYVSNSTLFARVPFYRYATSTNRALAQDVTNRLASRYSGQAFQYVYNQVTGWPSTVDVAAPSISIRTVDVTPDQNFATLTTVETWRVTTEQGAPLFVENGAFHTVHMARVPGVILHKWVVTSIQ